MTLEQIDAILATWQQRLATVADNLLWLQGESTYKMFLGSGTGAPLTGLTQARVEPVLTALRVTFEHFSLLHATVDHAAHLRKSIRTFFGAEHRIAELEHLLCGRSVELPPVDLPIDQRTLLTGAHSGQHVSLAELLAPMSRSFNDARDLVLEVDATWQRLAQGIGQAEATLAQLDAAADTDRLRRQLEDIRTTLHTDPLGALEELDRQLQPALDGLAQTLAARQQLAADLASARRVCNHLQALDRDTQAALAAAQAQVTPCDDLPAPIAAARRDRLCAWLDQLEHRFGEGAYETAVAGLRHWNAAASDCVSESENVLSAATSRAGARRELRGRLDAMKAKARSRNLAEAPELACLARDAEALLDRRPAEIDRIGEHLAAYARALNTLNVEVQDVPRR